MNDDKNKKGSHFRTAVTAATIGAVAGAAGVILSDKKNREKLSEKVSDLQKKAQETKDDIQHRMMNVKTQASREINKRKKEMSGTANKTKKQAERKMKGEK